ncbi:MAG: endolytic transglycosylase MltG [Candidatus Kerfeldbacteria bacterium]|nr:endolytic transglycosylase MltG [Candidatus Kerfeldbacteria bacterium]
MNKKRIIIICVAIVGVMCMAVSWFAVQIYVPKNDTDAVSITRIQITSGSSVSMISHDLQAAHIIRSPLAFRMYAMLSGKSQQLQAGVYEVSDHQSVRDLVDLIAAGKVIDTQVKVTVVEGKTAADIEEKLSQSFLFVDNFDEIIEAGDTEGSSSIIFQGKPKKASFEGYLFPETYKFFPNATSHDIVWKMINTLDEKITDEMRTQIAQSDLSFYEILTLASIIEKEVRTPEERRVVAGIFLQRLADNYPLESDATVNYVTHKGTTRPSHDDLLVESLYNTYTHAGLPPGPICNPGWSAITAVLDPVESDYYFFLTTPDGIAVFSKTYEEHLQNKAKYYP